MKKILLAFAAISIITLSITSCAEEHEDNIYDVEQKLLDAWMNEHEMNVGPDEEQPIRYSNGIYIKWLKREPLGAKPAYGNWLKLNYTGMSLDGKVFKNRSKEVAIAENQFSEKTNYVPAYINYYESNGLTEGENFAIGQMREGEKVIAYIPSKLAFDGQTETFSNGYGGHYSITAQTGPVKIEIELVDVVENASIREKELIVKCIKANGLTDASIDDGGDMVREGLYAKVLTQHKDTPEAEWNKEDLEKWGAYTKVDKDDELYIYRDVYVIQEEKGNADGQGNPGDDQPKQVDGEFGLFLVSTDRIELAIDKWNDFTPYTPVFVRPSISSETVVFAIREALQKLDVNYMSSLLIVTTSEFTYGQNGYDQGTEPYGVIQPYTPLLIKVYVERKTYESGTQQLADETGGFGTPK